MVPFSVMSVHLTSSKSLVGMAGVISEIQREKKASCFSCQIIYIDFLWVP